MDYRSRNPTAMRLSYELQAKLLQRYPKLYVLYVETRKRSGYAEIVPFLWRLLGHPIQIPERIFKGGENK